MLATAGDRLLVRVGKLGLWRVSEGRWLWVLGLG